MRNRTVDAIAPATMQAFSFNGSLLGRRRLMVPIVVGEIARGKPHIWWESASGGLNIMHCDQFNASQRRQSLRTAAMARIRLN